MIGEQDLSPGYESAKGCVDLFHLLDVEVLMLQAREDGAEILLTEGLSFVFFDYLLYGNT